LISSKFRAIQAPYKQRYKEHPKDALVTLKARGTLDDTKVICRVKTGLGMAIAGMHPKTGGSGLELCSGDLLLESLVACAGVAMKAAATTLDISLKSAVVSAEGDVDLRGALGLAEYVPVGFKEIRVRFDVITEASKARVDELLALTERYCVVYHTLRSSPRLNVRLNAIHE
jgi:uncharacterized OsmC-like protein